MTGFFGRKPQAAAGPSYSGVDLQTSALGVAIPILFGQDRLPPNLIWYGDFRATKGKKQGGKGGITGGGKGGSSPTTYSASVALSLAEGAITSIGRVWNAKAQTSLSQMQGTLFSGATGQAPWGYLQTSFPSDAFGYSDTAYVGAANMQLGETPTLGNFSFECQSEVSESLPGSPDVDLADISARLITDARRGLGLAMTVSSTPWINYCRALGLTGSLTLKEQIETRQVLEQLARAGNARWRQSGASLVAVPQGDQAVSGNGYSWEPPSAPLFDLTYDDFLQRPGQSPVEPLRRRSADRRNVVKVEWKDRAKEYNTAVTEAADDASVAQIGRKEGQVVQAHVFKRAEPAQLAAQFALQAESRLSRWRFRLDARYSHLEPLDIVTITCPLLQLDRVWVRILEIDEDFANGALTLEVEEYGQGTGSAGQYSFQTSAGFSDDWNAPAPNVAAPAIFEPAPDLTDGTRQAWIAVTGLGNWGGCEVWISDDGSTYRQADTVYGGARYGTLQTALPSGSSPDTSNQPVVNLAVSAGELTSGTTADALALNTASLIGNEVIAFRDATLTAPSMYQLGYLVRGAAGTTIASHGIGTRFIRLDENIATYEFDETRVGKTIYLKFLSFNRYGGGRQSLADVSAYTYTLTGASFRRPIARDTLAVGGVPASEVLAGITAAVSDNVLTPGEKVTLVPQLHAVMDWVGLTDRATAYGITTEKTAYYDAVVTLYAYLLTLTTPVAWNNLSGNTTVTGSTLLSNFQSALTTRTNLQTRIDQEAGRRSETIIGTRPAPEAAIPGVVYLETNGRAYKRNSAGTGWDEVSTIGARLGLNMRDGSDTVTLGDNDVLNWTTNNNALRVAAPVGGSRGSQNIESGAIRIDLPVGPADNTFNMVKFEISIFNYADGRSLTYDVAGYLFDTTPAWVNCTAKMIGSSAGAATVRFGRSGSKYSIWIGEPGGSWQYPQIVVRNVTVGFSTPNATLWRAGWNVAFDTAAATHVNATITNPTASDAMFGINTYEEPGGILATRANFRTDQGTAAAIAGQTDWATYAGRTTGDVNGRLSYLRSDGSLRLGSGNGLTNEAGDAWLTNANTITALGIASGFAGQGSLSLLNAVDLSTSQVINKSLANLDSGANTKLGGIAPNAGTSLSLIAQGSVTITGNTVATSAINGNWLNSAYSRDRYTGSAFVSGRPRGVTNGYSMIGLTDSPAVSASYTNIDYAWYTYVGGGLQIYESGTLVAALSDSWDTNSVFSIEYDGVSIIYRLDGVAKRTVTPVAAGRTFAAQVTCYGVSLTEDGYTDIQFGSHAQAARLGTNVWNSAGTASLGNTDVITSQGVASAISGQTDWATYTGLTTGAVATRVSRINSSGYGILGSSGLMADETNTYWLTNANTITSLGVASAIAGQGSLATRGDVLFGTHIKTSGGTVVTNAEALNYNDDAGGIGRVENPVGGTSNTFTAVQSGALRITLPDLRPDVSTMMTMIVDIYEYGSALATTYEVSGYTWEAGASWINCTAKMTGASAQARPVRFGFHPSNNRWCVWIGEAGGTWSYPQVRVRSVQLGWVYGSAAAWRSGWVVDYQTTAITTSHVAIADPNPGDAVFGVNARESMGGTIATNAAYKTSLGTASAIAGQAPAATDTTIQAGATVNRITPRARVTLGSAVTNTSNTTWTTAISVTLSGDSAPLAGGYFEVSYSASVNGNSTLDRDADPGFQGRADVDYRLVSTDLSDGDVRVLQGPLAAQIAMTVAGWSATEHVQLASENSDFSNTAAAGGRKIALQIKCADADTVNSQVAAGATLIARYIK